MYPQVHPLATASSFDDDSIPEWGDPYIFPAGYGDFVSFHPPGSEGWPYPQLSYLRPWNPPGASTSDGMYNAAAWPVTNGYFGETTPRHRGTAYPLTNQPIFSLSGDSRPGPIMATGPRQLVPHELIETRTKDASGCGYVDLNSDIQYDPWEPAALIDISHGRTDFIFPFGPTSLSHKTTVPPCKWMELEHPQYPWKIRVTAKLPSQGELAGVTVEDVLTAVCDDLRREVSNMEALSLPRMSDPLGRHRSMLMNCNRQLDDRSRLKRLHWLGTHTVHFLGISPHEKDPARWIMHFGHDKLPEKPLPALPPITPIGDPPAYSGRDFGQQPSYLILERNGLLRVVQSGGCRPPRYPRDRKRPVVYQSQN